MFSGDACRLKVLFVPFFSVVQIALWLAVLAGSFSLPAGHSEQMSDSHSDEPLEVLPSPSHRSRSSSAARSSTCPLCNLSVRDDYALWQHINLAVAAFPVLISYVYMVVAFVLLVVLPMPAAGISAAGLKDLVFRVVGQP